ncbi:MAG: maltose alpha-D-glucosyltransferase [Timaviella obliquedivisa GSE-PSE-MK23-08B]|jgi:maltose alpha-D-glucosyltransferase/alpha-amylase|nr:maltose alpha-D-glucosyltransferase [Timaviella obliquedivisa GSE-PSE-MK23-08B]
MQQSTLHSDPLWFKDAIIYEVPVRAFADSDSDGIGDFRGLTEKLDYIQDLGVTAVWVLPFFPSPLRDDGYDIADYNSVNPIYGNLEDFHMFLEAAHQRNIRVIIELIVNHTSDQHPWFQRARKALPGSSERDFYVWSDTPNQYQGVRIIFQDFETSNWTWDPVAKAYFWHRFYSHQPDLNYEHPQLQKAIFDVVDFWLEMGVDGLRMDAVPYLYEREGTNCENLPKTHDWLKQLRAHVDRKFPNRMLLAEANQWPEDAAEYYGQGDECHMNFHFPLMPRLFMSLQMEDSFPIIDILQQTPEIPPNCQWALFLRNHDELTLEMVSDEDRDYMYRVYAQDPQARINLGIRRRLAPLMGNNRRRIELMNSLLLSLPGTPVLYYGDEIGMGDNFYLGDRNGVRTPMQWSSDRNAGFSRANPQRLYAPPIVDPEYNYETVNVEAQRANSSSLWWWMKRLIAVRSRYQAFGRGTFEVLSPENRKVLAFTRTYDGEHILVVANLSRFVQAVELDLSAFQGMMPIEIFGRTEFPPIADTPYFLSLGPHSFLWFTLQIQPSTALLPKAPAQLPTLTVSGHWQDIYSKADSRKALEALLPDFLRQCRWFGSRNRSMQSAQIADVIPFNIQPQPEANEYHIVLVKAEYTEGVAETYVLPLAYAVGNHHPITHTEHAIAQIKGNYISGILFDAFSDKDFLPIPLEALIQEHSQKGSQGEIVATLFEPANLSVSATPHLPKVEHGNALVVYGDRLIFKLFRRAEECINSDIEMGRFLTQRSTATDSPSEHFAPIIGSIEYRRKGVEAMALGMFQKYIPDTRDAWSFTLDSLRDFFEKVMAQPSEMIQVQLPQASLVNALTLEVPELAYEIMGTYLGAAELLGQRTAEMHIALAADENDPSFAPEPFTLFHQRSVYQYMRNQAGQIFLRLKKQLKKLPIKQQASVRTLLNEQSAILDHYKRIVDQPIAVMRIRCHGNYHLEEVLYTGKDFVIIDFEGEASRPLSERRMKRSPIRDVASMVQSFYYASRIALQREVESGVIRTENLPLMEQWAQFVYYWTSVVFLKKYLATASGAAFLPKTQPELQVLLDAFLLEKAVYELGYEMEARPDWTDVPLQRILELLGINPDKKISP